MLISSAMLTNCTSPDFKMPPFPVFKDLLESSQVELKKQKMLIELGPGVTVIGDLHGNWEATNAIANHSFVSLRKKAMKKHKLLFLGDYVDRGKESIRILLFIASLAIEFPGQIFLLRGNHELAYVNKTYGLLKECKNAFPDQAEEAHLICNVFFSYMSVAALIGKRILCMHGGVTSDFKLETINKYSKPLLDIPNDHELHPVLWTDCIRSMTIGKDKNKPDSRLSTRGQNCMALNPAAFKKWMNKNKIQAIIRGHQFVPYGIDFRADNRFITVFSTFNYERFNNTAAIITIFQDYSIKFSFFRMPSGKKPQLEEDVLTFCDADGTMFKETVRAYTEKKGKVNAPEKATGEAEEPKKAVTVAKKTKATGEKATPEKKKSKETSKSKGGSRVSTPIFSAISLFMIIFCLLAGSVAGSSSPPKSTVYSQNTVILSRLVNGIALGQSLANRNLNKKLLINELFPIGPNQTLDSLESFKADQLNKDLDSIQEVIGSECSGDNGCAVSQSILDGMAVIDTLKVHVGTIKNSIQMSQIGEFAKIGSMATMIGSINSLDSLKTTVVGLIEKLRNKVDISELNNLITTLRHKPKFIDRWNVVSVDSVTQTLNSQANSVSSLKTAVTSAQHTHEKLSSSINTNAIRTILTSIDHLLDLNPFAPTHQNLTAGFHYGFDDFKLVPTDDDNSHLKNFINSGKKLDQLTSKLAPLKVIVKEAEPLHSSFKTIESLFANDFWKVKSQLMEVTSLIAQLSDLSSTYSKCVQNMDLSIPYNSGVSQIITKLQMSDDDKSKLAAVNKFFTEAVNNKTFLNFEKILEKLDGYEKNVMGLDDFLRDDPLINQTIAALEEFDRRFKALNMASLVTWISGIPVPSLGSGLNKWSIDTGFVSSIECLKDVDYVGKIKDLNPGAKSASSLQKDVKPLMNMAASIKTLSAEWTKVKDTPPTKPKRAADSELKNADKISKDLGEISSNTLKLDRMLAKESELNVIIKAKQLVSKAIDSVTDPAKAYLKEMWTEEFLFCWYLWIIAGVIIAVIGAFVGFWKREWIKEKLKKPKRADKSKNASKKSDETTPLVQSTNASKTPEKPKVEKPEPPKEKIEVSNGSDDKCVEEEDAGIEVMNAAREKIYTAVMEKDGMPKADQKALLEELRSFWFKRPKVECDTTTKLDEVPKNFPMYPAIVEKFDLSRNEYIDLRSPEPSLMSAKQLTHSTKTCDSIKSSSSDVMKTCEENTKTAADMSSRATGGLERPGFFSSFTRLLRRTAQRFVGREEEEEEEKEEENEEKEEEEEEEEEEEKEEEEKEEKEEEKDEEEVWEEEEGDEELSEADKIVKEYEKFERVEYQDQLIDKDLKKRRKSNSVLSDDLSYYDKLSELELFDNLRNVLVWARDTDEKSNETRVGGAEKYELLKVEHPKLRRNKYDLILERLEVRKAELLAELQPLPPVNNLIGEQLV
uniref:Serine/threonine-protein phosphatase n=1 Tax=Caenorhabditis tropicalis TaxID=1561998 RepID=A0A1I7UP79_9PELO